MIWRKSLALEINVRSEVDRLPDRPAQSDSHDAAENAHGSSFRKEKFLDVTVAGANRLHDADFAAALKDRHYQGIYNSDEGDSQSQTAEDSEKHIEHLEKLLDTAAGIENRERIKPHLLDSVFYLLHLTGIFHMHAYRGINRLIAGMRNFTQVGRLHHVQILGQSKRQEYSSARRPPHAFRVQVGNSDNRKFLLSRNDRVGSAGQGFGSKTRSTRRRCCRGSALFLPLRIPHDQFFAQKRSG